MRLGAQEEATRPPPPDAPPPPEHPPRQPPDRSRLKASHVPSTSVSLKVFCDWYFWCERDHSEDHSNGKGKGTGKWKEGVCDVTRNMYWNPHRNGTSRPEGDGSAIHGGMCDYWGNLDKDLQDEYKASPDCDYEAHCDWFEVGECSEQYVYYNPDKLDGDGLDTITCPKWGDEQMLWSQEKKACLHCSEVDRVDGTNCCPAWKHY